MYLLDEPTTGLHFDDVKKLLEVLHRLTDLGNTVMIIEHNLDVIRNADWIIDLGPEGGEEGGRIVAQGTPEQVARNKKSYTGQALAGYFANGQREKSSGIAVVWGGRPRPPLLTLILILRFAGTAVTSDRINQGQRRRARAPAPHCRGRSDPIVFTRSCCSGDADRAAGGTGGLAAAGRDQSGRRKSAMEWP